MKTRRVLAMLLVCSMLAPAMLCSCKKGSTTDSSETEDERIDLDSTTTTHETKADFNLDSMTAYSCPDPSLVHNTSFYKRIPIHPIKDIPVLQHTYADAVCCDNDGFWLFIDSPAHFLKYDYEGNLQQSVRMSFDDVDLELQNYYGLFSDMFIQDGKPHLIFADKADILEYELDPDTATLNKVRSYTIPLPKHSTQIAEPTVVGITDEAIYFSCYCDSLAMSYYSLLVSFTRDGSLIKNQMQINDQLTPVGGWMIDDQFYSVFSNGLTTLIPLQNNVGSRQYMDYFPFVRHTEINGTKQFLIDSHGLWVMDRKTGEWSNTFRWNNTDYDPNDYYYAHAYSFSHRYKISPDGQNLLMFNDQGTGISLFTASDDPRENRTVITLSCELRGSRELMDAVRTFNEENKDYYIQVDYETLEENSYSFNKDQAIDIVAASKAETEHYMERMKSGKGPVLFVQKYPHKFSYYSGSSIDELIMQNVYDEIYTHKEFFKDLRPLWEELDPKWQEQFIQTRSSDGKNTPMYSIPYSATELFFEDDYKKMGSSSFVKYFSDNKDNSYTSWLNTLNQNCKGAVLVPDYSSETMLFYMLSNDLPAFTKADGTVDLHDPQFRALLEMCSTYFLAESDQLRPTSLISSVHINYNMLPSMDFSYVYPAGTLSVLDEPKGVYMPLPSASGDKSIVMANQQFYVSSSATQEEVDGAWAFIRYALEKNSNLKLSSLMDNLDAYEHPSDHFDFWYDRYNDLCPINPSYIQPASHEQIESYIESIQSSDRIVIPDMELYKIIVEETADYMVEKESIDEVIERLQKRINEYLKGN